jgi:hypothetical protein
MVIFRMETVRASSIAVLVFLMVLAFTVVPVVAQKTGDKSWLSMDKLDWQSDQKRFAVTETSTTMITPVVTLSNKKSDTATITKVEFYFKPELKGKFTWTGSETVASGASVKIQVILEVEKGQNPTAYDVSIRVLVTYSGTEYSIDYGKVDGVTLYRAGGGVPGFPWESIAAGLAIGTIILISRRKNTKIFGMP